jgi:hypothetical protein
MAPRSAQSPRRIRRAATLAAAIAVVASLAGPSAAAYAAPAPARAAAPAAHPGDESPVVAGKLSLGLAAGLDIDGSVSLKIGSGKIIHGGHRIQGGEVRLKGSVTLKGGGKKAVLTDLSINIATGTVLARFNGRPVELGYIDTETLHVASKPGSKLVFNDVGYADDNNIELTTDMAEDLNELLGTELDGSDVLLTGGVNLGLNLNARLAADLAGDADVNAVIEAGIDADIDLDTDIDIDLGLDVGVDTEVGISLL